jgi:hypothetical protein
VGAGTVDDIGFRFRPFFEALRQPGRIHALGIACPPLSFVFELPRIWLARPVAHPDIRSVTTTHLHMRSERPIAYMVDGDFCTGGAELDLRIGPPVELLLPG